MYKKADKLTLLCCQVNQKYTWEVLGEHDGMTGIFTALDLGRDAIWLHLWKWCSFILPASLQTVRKELLEPFHAPLNLFFNTQN